MGQIELDENGNVLEGVPAHLTRKPWVVTPADFGTAKDRLIARLQAENDALREENAALKRVKQHETDGE